VAKVATKLLIQGRAAGLSVTIEGRELAIRAPRTAEPHAKQLLACKPDLIAALVSGEAIPAACPLCGSKIRSVVSKDGAKELFGCRSRAGEHWHRWTERKSIVCPS
jgi:hypothetical protein